MFKFIFGLMSKNKRTRRNKDIGELRISFDHPYGKTIVLTKGNITYRNTISPAMGPMRFSEGYFDTKERAITAKQFRELSDAIYEAGLQVLLRQDREEVLLPGASYSTLTCVLDDGTQYVYRTHTTPEKEFDAIAQILLPLCDFPRNEIETPGFGTGNSVVIFSKDK